MTAMWPSELPRPMRANYGEAYDDLRVTRTADAGPPSFRNRMLSVVKTTQVSLALPVDRLMLFRSFYEETLKNGALPFWMADAIEDGLPLLLDDGTPLLATDGLPILQTVNRLYLFGRSLPQTVPHGVGYQVTFNLSRMPV